jgi:hypothetical protein
MFHHVKKFALVLILLLVLVFPFLQVSKVYSTEATARNKALSLIENVLPIDISQYNVTVTKYRETELPSDLSNGFSSERVTYTLKSEESIIDVICNIENDVLSYCLVSPKKGSVISDREYANLIDAATSFLDKYQTYTGEDLEEIKNILIDVDPTENMTVTAGDIKLTISNGKFWGNNETAFDWRYVYNGCEYPGIFLVFSNGVFSTLNDGQIIYTIGNTTVNISQEQAINIAMNHITNYSYAMPGGSEISDFNVTEERTEAWLVPSPREPYTLYPLWNVMLYLNQTYPGSVYALLVSIWADSGQVSSCSNQAAGGIIPEFPTWTPILIMLVTVMAVAVIYGRILNKPNGGRRG